MGETIRAAARSLAKPLGLDTSDGLLIVLAGLRWILEDCRLSDIRDTSLGVDFGSRALIFGSRLDACAL
jgi:hypothetical protein